MSKMPGWLSGYRADGGPYQPRGRWGVFASHLRGYLQRWIVRTPWGDVRLHRFLGPDPDDHYHDHPWDFSSLILWGSYIEDAPSGLRPPMPGWLRRTRGWGSLAFYAAETMHTIWSVKPGTLTLVLTGPLRRDWGFLTERGWVSHKEYFRG